MITVDPRTHAMIARHSFDGVRESIGEARAWAESRLAEQGVDAPRDLALVLSELATNCVQHTRSGEPGGTFAVRLITHADRIRVEVRDNGSLDGRVPVRRVPPPSAERGRGLFLVGACAETWGVLPTGSGVFAEVPR